MNVRILLRQLIEGNQLAFKQLYEHYAAEVYTLAYHIVKDQKCAEELVQDTFLEVWNQRARMNSEGNLGTYLYVICRNKSFNKLKVVKRHQARFASLDHLRESVFVAEENTQESQEIRETIECIVAKLPSRQQQIFRLCRIDGFSHKEIAELLGISVQTVKNQMVSALRFVREEWAKNSTQLPPSLIALLFLGDLWRNF